MPSKICSPLRAIGFVPPPPVFVSSSNREGGPQQERDWQWLQSERKGFFSYSNNTGLGAPKCIRTFSLSESLRLGSIGDGSRRLHATRICRVKLGQRDRIDRHL